MELTEYQAQASLTAKYPGRGETPGLVYTTLGLAGEAGEIANKVKKILRDDDGELTEEVRDKLVDELGDVLWYTAMVADELYTSLNVVGRHNLNKLKSRAHRGVIAGSGDDR